MLTTSVKRWRGGLAVAACLSCGMAGDAAAQDMSRMTIIAGFSAGGTYDATARLFARHLGRYLPGHPTITVQNMPGAGSMAAANHLYNVAPRDGSVLAVINGAMVFEPLFGNPAARFDPRMFAWIGSRSTETALCAVWHTAPVNTFRDVMTREIAVGSTGPGSRTYNHPQMFNALLGTRFRVVVGYPGGAEITLAMERGELDGYCGWAWGSIRSRSYDWVRDRKMRLLVQAGVQKIAELPEVPFALDLAKNRDDQDVMRILVTDTQLAWPLLAPPGLSAERIAALRTAFDAAMKDAELRRDAERMQLEVEPVGGEAMQASIAQLFGLSTAVIERAKAIVK
jgi:tripartite-type tricarboxylate transporter receptor subunit TctC